MNKVIKKILIAIIFVMPFKIYSQDLQLQLKLRTAQNLQQAGEYEKALLIYEQLYESYQDDYSVTNGLIQTYSQLREYDKAIVIARNLLKKNPNDISLIIMLGRLYFDYGKENIADSIWYSVLDANSNNIYLYRSIADGLMERRRFEKCIQLYLRARQKTKNEILFADEIGILYSALHDYEDAVKEYIRLVKVNPQQVNLAQSRLSKFIYEQGAKEIILKVISEALRNSQSNVQLHKLHAWSLMETGQFDEAMDVYKTIDRISDAKGKELLLFADRLIQEKQPRVASKAYKWIVDDIKNSELLPQAKYGYARCMELMDAEKEEKYGKADYSNSILLYGSLIDEYAESDIAMQALYRIGTIKLEKYFDLDAAFNAFDNIRKKLEEKRLRNLPGIYFETVLKIGDIYTIRNNLMEAKKEYKQLANLDNEKYKQLAMFKLAELEYYQTNFDSALAHLNNITANLNIDIANDALQLKYFIQENRSSTPQALKEFATSDLLFRQNKLSESLFGFRNIIRSYPNALLIDDALMKIAEIYIRLGKTGEAISTLKLLIDSVKYSVIYDKAQFRIAEIYHFVLRDEKQAILEYEKLLEKYPNSLFAEESRKRIRLLRGEKIVQ